MTLSRLFNVCMMVILLLVTLLLVRVQIGMVRDSIHDQMAANLETASTSLGLVLQGAFLGGDPVMAETIVNAMFDGGYVKSIRLVDPDGKELFKREFADDEASAPDWLVQILAFPRTELSREITDGWNVLGTLHIEGHRGYAYGYLWRAVQSQLWILGIGLPLAVVAIALLGHVLLRPLRRAIIRIAILSRNHLPGTLPGSAIRELDALAQSVNQLIQEKHLNYLRRKLKLLRWRQSLGFQKSPRVVTSLTPPSQFRSTQGDMLLYQRLPIPMSTLLTWRQSESRDSERIWLEFQRIWPLALAEPGRGVPISLTLLADPWWPQLRALLSSQGPLQLEWQATADALPEWCFERLSELSRLGFSHQLGNFMADKSSFLLLEKMQPQWVITSWQPDIPPAYWILHNVTVHDLGAGVLLESAPQTELLLELEFNGYSQVGGSDGLTP